MPQYRIGLFLAMIGCAAACTPPSNAPRTSTVGTSATSETGSTPTTRATVTPQPTPSHAAASGHKVGFETSLGWCGPEHPLLRTTVLIYFEPDGVHPTCVSVGPTQRLGIVNRTNMDGYAGSPLTVELPGAPQRLVSPGAQVIFPGSADQVLHEARTTVILKSHLYGLDSMGS